MVHGDGQSLLLDTTDTYVYSSKGRLVAALGLEGFVVVDTDDALLICPKDQAQAVRDVVDKLKEEVLAGNVSSDYSFFKVALKLLEITAQEMGKDAIDKEVIHEYFWKKHSPVVMQRMEEYGDVSKECLISAGKLVEGNYVDLGNEKRKVNIDFTPNAKSGDFVVVHYDYAVEKITEDEARCIKDSSTC